MKRNEPFKSEGPFIPKLGGAFICSKCTKAYEYPFQATWCEGTHENDKAVKASRAERLLLRLLAMVDTTHAAEAGQFADEILEAIRT